MKPTDLPRACGVYLIRCNATGDTYIGSAHNIQSRCATHRSGINTGKGCNRGLRALVRVHGISSLTMIVLELCARADRYDRERHWIAKLRPSLNVDWPALPKRPGEVRVIFKAPREDRARFKYFCERLGLEMERVGPQWILERLALEEDRHAARKPQQRGK